MIALYVEAIALLPGLLCFQPTSTSGSAGYSMYAAHWCAMQGNMKQSYTAGYLLGLAAGQAGLLVGQTSFKNIQNRCVRNGSDNVSYGVVTTC